MQYQKLLNELNSLEYEMQQEVEDKLIDNEGNKLIDMLAIFDGKFWGSLKYEQRKYAVKELIQEVSWDGREVNIFFRGKT